MLASAFALAGAGTALALLAACGQRGPLYIPDTPAAAQRATLPQTIYGGSGGPSAKASAPLPQPALPDARTID
ncbi:MAG: lipoprotein [Pseudomonadota bacterium]|nr:lipoprotein [Pseudomonadota bacterium]